MAEDEGLYSEILTLSRQAGNGGLAPWFDRRLREQIGRGLFLDEARLGQLRDRVIAELSDYRQQAGITPRWLRMAKAEFRTKPAPTFWELRAYSWLLFQAPMPLTKRIEHWVGMLGHYLKARRR